MKQDIINIWKNVQELDLRPIRELAEQDVRLALVGASGAGKRTLANQLCSDPERPDQRTLSPILLTDLELAEQAISADVIVLVVDVNISNVEREQALLDNWLAAGKRTIIFYNKIDLLLEEDAVLPWLETGRAPKIYGSALDRGFLQRELAPALMEALPDLHLALGRRFPLLREPAARNLIRQTCLANAAYSLGTGLAEIVPVLDIPLNIADVIVLTKAQALLVYKLGLTLGLSKDWPYYVGEFGSVIGGGFLWRQVARQLVGLIPVWGIVPKVAVAYSGTYVVGQAVLAWYLTGRHISRKKMGELSRQAFTQGKTIARNLLEKAPRPRLKRPRLGRRKRKALPTPSAAPSGDSESTPDRGALTEAEVVQVCLECETVNDGDANFCKHCGEALGAGPYNLPN